MYQTRSRSAPARQPHRRRRIHMRSGRYRTPGRPPADQSAAGIRRSRPASPHSRRSDGGRRSARPVSAGTVRAIRLAPSANTSHCAGIQAHRRSDASRRLSPLRHESVIVGQHQVRLRIRGDGGQQPGGLQGRLHTRLVRRTVLQRHRHKFTDVTRPRRASSAEQPEAPWACSPSPQVPYRCIRWRPTN